MHDNREHYAKICELIRGCDEDNDAIVLSMKLKTINQKLRETIKDEKSLNELFDYFNKISLDEGDEFIHSLILVLTSKQLESFTVNGKILRHAMLSICQKNFQNVDNYKRDNVTKFYNSLKLLGEFFNKSRTANGQPINILGQSLLSSLNVELEKELRNISHFKNDEFSKLILSQITLNGQLLKTRHKTDIDQVLFTVRKCLIELDCLSSKTRAFLLMTLDLCYSNFTTLGDALEKMYQGFLLDEKPRKPIVDSNKTERIKARESLEKLTITKSPPRRQVVQSPLPVKHPHSPLPRVTPPPPSPQRNAIPLRNAPKISPPNRTMQNGNGVRKSSPQDLRNRNSPTKPQQRYETSSPSRKPQRTHFERSPRRGEPSSSTTMPPMKNRRSFPPPRTQTNSTNNENILRQQNPHSPDPQPQSEPTTPVKYKTNNNKAYYREENLENFSWASDGEYDDLDNSTSPKVNPYTTSFLNFLSNGK